MMSYIYNSILRDLDDYDNVAFDLDGTLYKQEEYDFLLYKSYFEKYYTPQIAQSLSLKLSSYKRKKGYGYKKLYDDFIEENPDVILDVKELVLFGRKVHKFDLKGKCELTDVLIKLKKLGKRLSLITNGWHQTQINKIRALGIKHYFDDIVILSPFSKFPMKPNPSVIASLNFKGKTVYLGDQDIDEEFAKNSKIDFRKIVL